MLRRMVGAALLQGHIYRELRDDPVATLQAFQVILLTTIALALPLAASEGSATGAGLSLYIRVFTWAFSYFAISWLVLSLLAYWVRTRLMRVTATFPSFLGPLGFSNVPGLFYLLLVVPAFFMGGSLDPGAALRWISAIILFWTLIAMIVALRQALAVSGLVGFWMAAVGMFISISIRDLLFQGLLGAGLPGGAGG